MMRARCFTPLVQLRAKATMLGFVLVMLLTMGCGQAVTRKAVPKELTDQALITDMPGVRFWGDRVDPELQRNLLQTMREHPITEDPRSEEGPGYGGLVLSGGGDCGAYGAGLLCGWTERGDRPRFRLVTGVSTGSLIAPFAFLGPKYDDSLRFYTKVSANDIVKKRGFIDWLRYDSLLDSAPLQKQLEKLVDEHVLRDIAIEHAKGRRLFVQTVNLDAQRPVIWDMGAIASSKNPNAGKLFRQVLVASASIPGAFPPQYIRVQAGGKEYDEMHVDGGTVSQMLMSTMPIDFAAMRKDMAQTQAQVPRVYIVRNAIIRPEWGMIVPKLFPIAGRSISTIIKAQGETELKLMYYEAKDAGIDFFLAYIPNEYQREVQDEFDNKEMNRMFQLGYDQVKNGTVWHRTPPRYEHSTIRPATAPSAANR